MEQLHKKFTNSQVKASNHDNHEIKKLQIQIAKLEQMIGKLTYETFLI